MLPNGRNAAHAPAQMMNDVVQEVPKKTFAMLQSNCCAQAPELMLQVLMFLIFAACPAV